MNQCVPLRFIGNEHEAKIAIPFAEYKRMIKIDGTARIAIRYRSRL